MASRLFSEPRDRPRRRQFVDLGWLRWRSIGPAISVRLRGVRGLSSSDMIAVAASAAMGLTDGDDMCAGPQLSMKRMRCRM